MPPTEISVLFSDKISAKKEPDLETICLAKKKKKTQKFRSDHYLDKRNLNQKTKLRLFLFVLFFKKKKIKIIRKAKDYNKITYTKL
jgi:hypothetical protein